MRILYWSIKIVSVFFLIPVVIIAIPGAILHFIAEEIENNK
jgi:hypothetical protein